MNRRFASTRARLRDRRGYVFVFLALAMVVLMGLTGLAIDSAVGYVNKAEVAKAVDAAALAGAKNVRAGKSTAEGIAAAISAANGLEPDGDENVTITVRDPNVEGEVEVFARATRRLDTTFMRVLGIDEMTVAAEAEARVPPIDLVLVLDQSGSMVRNGAWKPLQQAAKRFVGMFSDDVDQVGVVHFDGMAEVAVEMQNNFASKARGRIDTMKGEVNGDTNAEEGLTFGHREVNGKASRPAALKVVVFFTDGRPTAFRHEDGKDIGGQDGILTVGTKTTGKVLGWYRGPDQAPPTLKPDDAFKFATRCFDQPSCDTGGRTWNEKAIRDAARQEALDQAKAMRDDGIFIFTIGLGNKKATSLEEVPDEKLLEEMANPKGTGSGTIGGYFFAEKPEDLDRVFQAVAADILARLSQ